LFQANQPELKEREQILNALALDPTDFKGKPAMERVSVGSIVQSNELIKDKDLELQILYNEKEIDSWICNSIYSWESCG